MGEQRPPEIITTLTAIAPIVQWFLLIIGWYALHWTAAIRARRQEELSRIGDIAKRIEAIRDASIKYYTAHSDVSERSATQARLKNDLQSLASWIRLLRERKPNCYDLQPEQIAFRQAVTGGDFESAQGLPVAPDDPIVKELWYSADSFIVALHVEFEKANKRG